MEITLEKIELVKDRTGADYKASKEALEKSEGNVVDAIIRLEEEAEQEGKTQTAGRKEDLIRKMKEVVKKGNISKIVVSKDGEAILNIPVTVGILGTVIAPWGAIAGTVAALGFKCTIKFISDDGTETDISSKAEDLYETAKEKGTEVYGDIKEKAPEIYSELKEKGADAAAKAKDAAGAVKERVRPNEAVMTDEELDEFFDESFDDFFEVNTSEETCCCRGEEAVEEETCCCGEEAAEEETCCCGEEAAEEETCCCEEEADKEVK